MSCINLRMEEGRASRVRWFCSNLRIWSLGQWEMSRWMLDIWGMQMKDNLDHLVVVQVQLECLQGGNLWWDHCDWIVGEVQQGQLGQAAELKREAGQLVWCKMNLPVQLFVRYILCLALCSDLRTVRLWKDVGMAVIRLELILRWVSCFKSLPHVSSMWQIWFLSTFKILSSLKSATILGRFLIQFLERFMLRKLAATCGKFK